MSIYTAVMRAALDCEWKNPEELAVFVYDALASASSDMHPLSEVWLRNLAVVAEKTLLGKRSGYSPDRPMTKEETREWLGCAWQVCVQRVHTEESVNQRVVALKPAVYKYLGGGLKAKEKAALDFVLQVAKHETCDGGRAAWALFDMWHAYEASFTMGYEPLLLWSKPEAWEDAATLKMLCCDDGNFDKVFRLKFHDYPGQTINAWVKAVREGKGSG